MVVCNPRLLAVVVVSLKRYEALLLYISDKKVNAVLNSYVPGIR